ncbi:MAG: energy-coupling factor transporter transmembrane protein EcfT [Firmicutes bacterium]|nr:energy-coupling factor transporter transmembrane protein EcfT [Bacillota bacterium]
MASVVDYSAGSSIIHRLTPLAKMVWMVAVMTVALIFSSGYYLLALVAFVITMAAIAGILNKILPALKGIIIFTMVLVVMQVLFYQQGIVLFYLLPGEHLPVTVGAVTLGASMGMRMAAMVLSFILFLSTTQFKDIVLSLTEKLKLPYDYVFMFMTSLRFVPTFLTEIKQVREAQACRGCRVDGGSPMVKLKAYASVAVPMVLVSLQKAERLAMAMETRGYGSGIRTCFEEQKTSKIDYIAMFVASLAVLVSIIIRIQGMGV